MKKELIEEIFIECQEFQTSGNKKYPNGFNKGLFFSKIGEMDKIEFEEFMSGLGKLIHHKDTSVGLFAFDSDPHKFLYEFWQRNSDACPLELSEAEEQENQWDEWIDDYIIKITFD